MKLLKELLWPGRQISNEIGLSECAARKFLKNYGKTSSLLRKKGSGRKRKTTARQDHFLKHFSLKDPFALSGKIRAQLEEATQVKITVRLVRYPLMEFELVSRRPAPKLLLTARMKSQW